MLAPTISIGRRLFGELFDFWRIVNLFVVAYYWILIADLGQINPTTYPPSVHQFLRLVDFSGAQYHSPTNNIFRNAALFTYYTSYLDKLIGKTLGPMYMLPDFRPVEGDNLLAAFDTTLTRTYTCLKRQLKHPVNLMLSVSGLSLSLIMGIGTALIFLATFLERGTDLRQSTFDLETGRNDSNDGTVVGGTEIETTRRASEGEDQRETEVEESGRQDCIEMSVLPGTSNPAQQSS